MPKKPIKKKKPTIPPPTVKELKAFARKFAKGEWATCAESAKFRAATETDLKKAEIYAVKILSDRWDWINDSDYET